MNSDSDNKNSGDFSNQKAFFVFSIIYCLITHDGVRSSIRAYQMLSALMATPVMFKQMNSVVTAEGLGLLREVYEGHSPE